MDALRDLSLGSLVAIGICVFIGATMLTNILVRRQRIKYLMVMLVGWCLPGGAYWVIGRKRKAIFAGTLVWVTFLLGIFLADFRDVRMGDNPFYYVGRFGAGAILFLSETLLSYYPRGLVPLKFAEIGFLFVCVAGVLNLIIILSAFNPELTGEPDRAVPAATPAPEKTTETSQPL
ncbi:MAG: hypothetical protein KAS70_08305 [Planctomycetes bacterium]|nr:hypothetical protein [Planctomycetota bacterium]